jgi:hypothetical protein
MQLAQPPHHDIRRPTHRAVVPFQQLRVRLCARRGHLQLLLGVAAQVEFESKGLKNQFFT